MLNETNSTPELRKHVSLNKVMGNVMNLADSPVTESPMLFGNHSSVKTVYYLPEQDGHSLCKSPGETTVTVCRYTKAPKWPSTDTTKHPITSGLYTWICS